MSSALSSERSPLLQSFLQIVWNDTTTNFSSRQLGLLLLLDEGVLLGPPTVHNFSEVLGVAKAVITRTMNFYISLGLVTREKSEHDGRIVYMHITDRGRNLVQLMRA